MKSIILHIGDRVHHKTLGDGVVIAVNDDYCTVRFGKKEAGFSIPESFVQGYFSSDDAQFGSNESDKQIRQISSVPKKKKLGLVGWLLAIGFPAAYTFPFILVFLIIYLGTESTWSLLLTILGSLLYVLFVAYCVKKFKEPLDPSKPYAGVSSETDPDTDTAAQTAALMFGAGLLGHYIGKHHKSHSERVRDDWLWQEEYRHHDY